MSRRRLNGISTTLGSSLTSSATSITFAAALTYNGGTNVPTLSGSDYIVLSILNTSGNVIEIVYLTAYTAAGTSGTIVRGREGTTGAAHASGDPVISGPTVVDISDPSPPPRVPGTQDDEFDSLSSVSWSNGPTAPTTWDINSTIANKGYLRANGSGGSFVSVLQAIPGSYPFTAIMRVNSNRRGGSNLGLGLVLGPATPTTSSKILWLGPNYNGGSQVWQRLSYNSWSTSSFVGATTCNAFNNWDGAMWIKLVATSATSLALYLSVDGDIWTLVESGLNPGFTPGVMGVGMSENGTADLEGAVDFFRVT